MYKYNQTVCYQCKMSTCFKEGGQKTYLASQCCCRGDWREYHLTYIQQQKDSTFTITVSFVRLFIHFIFCSFSTKIVEVYMSCVVVDSDVETLKTIWKRRGQNVNTVYCNVSLVLENPIFIAIRRTNSSSVRVWVFSTIPRLIPFDTKSSKWPTTNLVVL